MSWSSVILACESLDVAYIFVLTIKQIDRSHWVQLRI